MGAGVGKWVGARLPAGVGEIAGRTIVATASSIGDAATRSLIEGSDFGDNMLAALPSVIGNALARGLIGAMTREEEELTPVAAIEAETLAPSPSVDLSALSAQLPTLERVGANGSFWAIAERQMGDGASNAQVRARVLELMAANPTLDPMHMDANSFITVPGGAVSVDATTLASYNAADAQYQTNLATRADDLHDAQQVQAAARMDETSTRAAARPRCSGATARCGTSWRKSTD